MNGEAEREMSEVIIVVSVLYVIGAIPFFVIAFVDYGDPPEKNLVRTVIKAARGLAWPVLLVIGVGRWARIYFTTRFSKEWREVFRAGNHLNGES